MKKEKLINFRLNEDFQKDLEAGELKDTSIIFVDDKKKIYTHGTEWDGNIPDWNANEGECGAILNKPFWETIWLDQTLMTDESCTTETFKNGWSKASFSNEVEIYDDVYYHVVIKNETQDVIFDAVLKSQSDFVSDGPDGEPYELDYPVETILIRREETGLVLYIYCENYGIDGETTLYLTLERMANYIQKIDQKFIPSIPNKNVVELEDGGIKIMGTYVLEGLAESAGERAHAEGNATNATGEDSHAEGGGTSASGSRSHAEGSFTAASGDCSHAEGLNTAANGQNSHAEGHTSYADGNAAHAEGMNNTSAGDYSHSEGQNNYVMNESEHASGRYSDNLGEGEWEGSSEKTLFTVGNGCIHGDEEVARHNAFEIRQNGDIYIPDTNSEEGEYYEKKMLKLQDCIIITETLSQKEYDNRKQEGTLDKNTFYFIKEEE